MAVHYIVNRYLHEWELPHAEYTPYPLPEPYEDLKKLAEQPDLMEASMRIRDPSDYLTFIERLSAAKEMSRADLPGIILALTMSCVRYQYFKHKGVGRAGRQYLERKNGDIPQFIYLADNTGLFERATPQGDSITFVKPTIQ